MERLLKLKAKHFEDTDFECNVNCAIAKAAREQFNEQDANASCTYLILNNSSFFKINYNYQQFKDDRKLAITKNFSEEIIRDVSLFSE